MATTTRSISHVGDMSTPQVSTCPVSRSMLLSAFNDNAALTLDVVWRVMLGAALAWCGAVVLPVQPGLTFFAALSASISVLYVANLADVKSVRDGIMSVVPAALVWGILAYDAGNSALVGLTLVTHLLIALFAGFARVTGSLRDLALWPVLFGTLSMVLGAYTEWFLR